MKQRLALIAAAALVLTLAPLSSFAHRPRVSVLSSEQGTTTPTKTTPKTDSTSVDDGVPGSGLPCPPCFPPPTSPTIR